MTLTLTHPIYLRRVSSRVVAVSFGLLACHRAHQSAAVSSTFCAPSQATPAEERIRIDGPGAFGPRLNDSLLVVVDGRERWRGVYAICPSSRNLQSAIFDWLPPADSIVSVEVIKSGEARKTYGIGGAAPSVLLIRTRRVPSGP